MAGENHGRDLIAELLVGEGLAGLGIARSAHQVEQIVRRRALVLAGSTALGVPSAFLRSATVESAPR